MKTEVSELVEQLYTRRKSTRAVKRAFVERLEEIAFAKIGKAASGFEFADFKWLVWLGYELTIDSKYLEGKYR